MSKWRHATDREAGDCPHGFRIRALNLLPADVKYLRQFSCIQKVLSRDEGDNRFIPHGEHKAFDDLADGATNSGRRFFGCARRCNKRDDIN